MFKRQFATLVHGAHLIPGLFHSGNLKQFQHTSFNLIMLKCTNIFKEVTLNKFSI